jgi:uncharacterized protein (TIGR02001 family)
LAQVTGSIAIESDFRLRGYTLSAGRPVASVRLGYDDDSGLYANGSGTVIFSSGDQLRLLGGQAAVGFAKRLGKGWSVDAGGAHHQLRSHYSTYSVDYNYTEAYVGLSRGPVSAYVFVSPNYFQPDTFTLYGQVEASVSPVRHWMLAAHVGSLNYFSTPEDYYGSNAAHYDWRVAAQREFGTIEAHVAVSGGGPGRQYFEGQSHSRTALTAGVSASF